MSATLLATRTNIQTRLRAPLGGNPLATTDEIDLAINDALLEIAGMDGVGRTWTTSLITLVTETYEYSVASEYYSLEALRCQIDDSIVEKVSPERLQAERRGNTQGGLPIFFSLEESTAQALKIWVTPTPGTNDNGRLLDGLVQVVPSSVSADSDTIPLGRHALKALELRAAAALISAVPQDESGRVRVNPNVAKSWMHQSDVLLAQEVDRLSGLTRQSDITLREA